MPATKLNIEGQRFGRLLVVGSAPKAGRRTMWACQCDCGTRINVTTVALRRKVRPVKSCGCLTADRTREMNTTHGMKGTREYRTWVAMRVRCLNPRSKDYDNYGGRGITICERWDSFESFYEDMGPRPEGLTIERINNGGNYEPGNCVWATPKQQANNRRRPRIARTSADGNR